MPEQTTPTCGEVGTSWPNDLPVDTEPCALPADHDEDHDWAQREAADEEIAKLREQLADAHAAGARSATEADQLRDELRAAAGALRGITELRDEALSREANLRTQLNRANTERQQLAQELAEVRNSAHRQKQALDAERAQWQAEIAALRSLISKYGDDGTIPVTAISTALREGPPVRPGSSRRAQEEPGRIDTEWWNRRALISDTLGRALWKRGHVVPRPGMCTYPVMLRQATPPAVQPTQRPATPTADTDLPAVTRYRWWRPWTRR